MNHLEPDIDDALLLKNYLIDFFKLFKKYGASLLGTGLQILQKLEHKILVWLIDPRVIRSIWPLEIENIAKL